MPRGRAPIPGIQFHSTINDWHTCPKGGEIRASNPCSEYMFLDDTACNLASLNLMTFRKDGENGVKQFDVEAFEHAVRLWTVVLEISVLMAQFPSKEIAQLSYEYRTLGLGYANIGGLLMAAGIPYDSREGRAIAGAITAILTGVSYATSAEMAGELGTFPRFNDNRDAMLRVIRNHRRAAYGESAGYESLATPPVALDHAAIADKALSDAAKSAWNQALSLGTRLRLPQRAGDRDRAHRHDRAADGLRHHRRRARFRAGEIQEARRRRLFQDHQPLRPRSAEDARLRRGTRSTTSCCYAVGHGTLAELATR